MKFGNCPFLKILINFKACQNKISLNQITCLHKKKIKNKRYAFFNHISLSVSTLQFSENFQILRKQVFTKGNHL